MPTHPEELHRHTLITNSAVPFLNHWPFVVKGKKTTVLADGRWRSNDTSVTVALVLQGLGIGRLSTPTVDDLVREKRLVPVLQEFTDEQPAPVYAVTQGNRHRLPKIRACIDWWAQSFAGQRGKKR